VEEFSRFEGEDGKMGAGSVLVDFCLRGWISRLVAREGDGSDSDSDSHTPPFLFYSIIVHIVRTENKIYANNHL